MSLDHRVIGWGVESVANDSSGSNIRQYQLRAAASVYSTARNVLPGWTTNYFLPETHATPVIEEPIVTTVVEPRRFVGFDVLRGRDVLVTATECGFGIYNVCHDGVELEELCGYSCEEVVYAKVPL
jgi:hypothetical protein